MSNYNYYYRDDDYNPAQSAEYTLLVQVGLSSLSYSVTGHQKLLILEKDVELKELTEQTEANKLLSASYKQRIIGMPQTGFTFVPANLYNPELLADLARFLDVKSNEKVFSQGLDADNQVVYKVAETIVSDIGHKYDIKDAVFGPKCWINAMASGNPSNNSLFVNIDSERVELLNFKEGKLRFYNSFEFKNEDELVYFTSFVAGELQLQSQTIKLVLSGEVEAGDKNFGRLAEFFSQIELNAHQLIDLPSKIPPHTVLTLTALSLCGSSEAH